MVTKGNIIYIKYSGISILECEVGSIDIPKNRIHFEVINGMWEGYFDITQSIIYVKFTREKCKAEVIHIGRVSGNDYNIRIDKIRNKKPITVSIACGTPRPYRTK